MTSASDSLSATAGDGTLRGEILALNQSTAPGANVIDFNISGSGTHTISLVGALSTITNAVTIDGSSQTGFTGTPLIVLDGTNADTGGIGLTIAAGNSTVKDLAIDHFNGDGIELETGGGDTLTGNYIGVDSTGKTSAANGFGVYIINSASNTIGAGNILSANTFGVAIVGSGATGNVVEGNYIGTDVTGAAKLGNTYGVVIAQGAASNTVGGTAAAALNVISGNSYSGLQIQDAGSTGNVVQGNYIGTDKTGAVKLGNGYGVAIYSASNTVDGGNVLSGNTFGVAIYGTGATGNAVQGNYIGTDATGAKALGNTYGVFIDGSVSNTVGGTTAAALNVISANIFGVVIGVSGTTGNVVEGNYIGTDKTGATALANTYGVLLYAAATNNTVGGTTTAARNVISGNTQQGVFLDGSGTTGNVVEGNYIGTDTTGAVKLGNTYGVVIADGASNNTVESVAATAPVNVISGNTFGAIISGSGTTGNVVQGNYIGTDESGTAALGNTYGVAIYASATGNTIGGTTTAARNIISANTQQGVLIDGSGAIGNVVEGNYIGTDVSGTNALGNADGVVITEGAANNAVGGTVSGASNVIANSVNDGVAVSTGTGNAIRQNTIYNSGNLGIELINNGNNKQAAPVLTPGTATSTSVQGTLTAADSTAYSLDFFASKTANKSGAGEGQLYLGSATVTTNASGTATFTKTFNASVPAGYVVSATATDPGGNTSQFATDVKTNANLFVVTTTSDSGSGSLRAAITAANAASGTGFIDFAISGSGAQTIRLASALPTITNPVVINGASQPGFAGTPLIVLDGANAGSNANGLTIAAGNSTVEDLVIDHFKGDGIDLQTGGGNVLIGNYIGVASDGTTGAGNGFGVYIEDGSANNTIGGTVAADRNVISANEDGVYITGSGTSGNVLEGNYIGTDVAGTAKLGNGNGVVIETANNTVGGMASGTGNVISGNTGDGVSITNSGSTGNVVEGNYIGTDKTGTVALGNNEGVAIVYGAASNTVDFNVISASELDGMEIDTGASGNVVERNYIGTNAYGAVNLGNGIDGVYIGSSNNTIGGTTIAYSGNDGVEVYGNTATGNAIRGNSIYNSTTLGIALTNGGNNSQAAPTLTSATIIGPYNNGATGVIYYTITIVGTLTAADSTAYNLDFFANPAGTPLGSAEGQQYLGSYTVTTNASGTVSFTTPAFTIPGFVTVGWVVSATAADPNGNTSQFSVGVTTVS